MKYLVEKFYNRFKDNSHFNIFQTLKDISEKGDSPVHDHTPNNTSPTPESRLRARKCILDEEEYWIDSNNEEGNYHSITSDYKDKQKKRQIGDDDTGYSQKDSPMKKKQKAISSNGKQPNTEKL